MKNKDIKIKSTSTIGYYSEEDIKKLNILEFNNNNLDEATVGYCSELDLSETSDQDSYNQFVNWLDSEKIIRFEFYTNYWDILPCVGINLYTSIIELRWLCFNLYIKYKKQ